MFTLEDALPFHEGESEVSRAKRHVKAYLQNHFQFPESLDVNQAFAPLPEQSIVTHYSDKKEHHRCYKPEIVRAAISQFESEGIILRDGEYLKRGANWQAIYRE
jgi:hypothetical protein